MFHQVNKEVFLLYIFLEFFFFRVVINGENSWKRETKINGKRNHPKSNSLGTSF